MNIRDMKRAGICLTDLLAEVAMNIISGNGFVKDTPDKSTPD